MSQPGQYGQRARRDDARHAEVLEPAPTVEHDAATAVGEHGEVGADRRTQRHAERHGRGPAGAAETEALDAAVAVDARTGRSPTSCARSRGRCPSPGGSSAASPDSPPAHRRRDGCHRRRRAPSRWTRRAARAHGRCPSPRQYDTPAGTAGFGAADPEAVQTTEAVEHEPGVPVGGHRHGAGDVPAGPVRGARSAPPARRPAAPGTSTTAEATRPGTSRTTSASRARANRRMSHGDAWRHGGDVRSARIARHVAGHPTHRRHRGAAGSPSYRRARAPRGRPRLAARAPAVDGLGAPGVLRARGRGVGAPGGPGLRRRHRVPVRGAGGGLGRGARHHRAQRDGPAQPVGEPRLLAAVGPGRARAS